MRNTVQDPAPMERATVTRCGFTCRIPDSTDRQMGKKASRKPNAILDAGPRPKKSISDGYQITLGIA